MLMKVQYRSHSTDDKGTPYTTIEHLFNVGVVKNDGKVWLLYNAFTGIPKKLPASLVITVSTQED